MPKYIVVESQQQKIGWNNENVNLNLLSGEQSFVTRSVLRQNVMKSGRVLKPFPILQNMNTKTNINKTMM